ncbi:SDR family oxidoreductase [Candidatus Poribacteria bacterium]|nr:SDR family oxidoreductase [Candidatus Poribacteria bacterium]
MAVPLEDRVVWVTGSARRVGRTIALRAAAAGADIVVHCNRSTTEAKGVLHEIEALERRAVLVQGDHADRGQVERMIERIADAFGRLDALVNSASIFPGQRFEETTGEDFARVIAANLRGPFLCSQLALPLLRKSPAPQIINIVDAMLARPFPGHAAYWCAKGGLDALTRALARELAPGIRVNSVSPGPVLVPEDISPGTRQAVLQRLPLARWGKPEDVADAVIFLLTSDYITGTDIPVDGGRRLG